MATIPSRFSLMNGAAGFFENSGLKVGQARWSGVIDFDETG
jgi:hypothetical protein